VDKTRRDEHSTQKALSVVHGLQGVLESVRIEDDEVVHGVVRH
jgi:hypothetical protein